MPAAGPEARTDLDQERRHLEIARAQLRRMRERVAALEAHGGDAVSGAYLAATLWQRMRALEDDPDVPLFFGRLDYARDDSTESFHVGRRHVTDAAGDPLVVDWRADISRPFYRASRTDPMELALRRRFGFQQGRLTGFEDEHLLAGEQAAESRILEQEIERPRVGPMRDIVATIQPEQDELVRRDLATSVCVQGAPGTGKTAVGLHRAAYLLYANRDQLRRQGVLVVGPNASFLRYIGDVLPALGEIEARQATVEELFDRVRQRGSDDAEVATLKGDGRMAAVLHRAVWARLRKPTEALVVPRGVRRWRVPAYEAAELVEQVRGRGVRYGAGRAILHQRLAHAVLVRMEAAGESPDDRVQNAVARSRPVKEYVESVWPALDPTRVVLNLLRDSAALATHADGLLDPAEQFRLLGHQQAKGPGSARWSVADAVLVDEVADLLERTPSLGHVVLDEAQDLSAMQLRAVGRRCSTGSATVLGDLAQATTPWASRSWASALSHLGKPAAQVTELVTGFRVPGEVLDFAARLLPVIAPGLAPPRSVRRTRGELTVSAVSDVVVAGVDAVRRAVEQPGSVGLVAPDAAVPELRAALGQHGVEHAVLGDPTDVTARVDLAPASLTKGLEFDHVVVVEPAQIVSAEPDRSTGLRRLYVCLTRAVTSLALVHARPLPSELSAPISA